MSESEVSTKEVYYNQYCPRCVHKDTEEVEEPCNSCLTQPWNENSHKPIKFQEGAKR